MEKEEKKKEDVKEVKKEKGLKSLVTCRVLFISVLDKIYLVILLLMLLGLTFNNFNGDLSSLDYNFWSRVGYEIVILIIVGITGLILNWFYRCAVKTMLCLTEKEVYKEGYVPFKRMERSIPLNKITGVAAHKYFWIIRFVVIYQYGRIPMVFFTWNNQEFKDKLTELITTDKEKVINDAEEKNIIGNDTFKYLKYLGIGLLGIILLIGIIRFFCYLCSEERKLAGTYSNKKDEIVLEKDKTCNIDDIREKVTECKWYYDKDKKEITVSYEYRSSYFHGTYTGSLNLKYDKKDKSLELDDKVFEK